MTTKVTNLTGIQANLTFSEKEVYAWYILPVPSEDYGTFPERAGLPKYLHSSLETFIENEKSISDLDLQFLISTFTPGNTPIVLVGIKMGEREEQITFIPKSINKFFNFIADAPVEDYISDKEFQYWEEKSELFNNFFSLQLGFKKADANQIAHVVRKQFYPEMSIPELLPKEQDGGIWGENNISEITQGTITSYPKYLKITQHISEQAFTAYRANVEIVKYNPESIYKDFEAWLPYILSFPFPVDFSVRLKINKKLEKTISTNIIITATSVDELQNKVEDIMYHYESGNMYTVWTSGDQVSLLNENLPNGHNLDYERREKSSDLSICHIYESLSFSKTDVYVWVKLPLKQVEFLSGGEKIGIANHMNQALTSLLNGSEEKSVECQLLIQGAPFDSTQWVKQLYKNVLEDSPLPVAKPYFQEMHDYVNDEDFRERQVLLGVLIGKRSTYIPTTHGAPTIIETALNAIPQPMNAKITRKEIEHWTVTGNQYLHQLSNSSLSAIPATASEIAFAVRKNFFPAMPLPPLKDLEVGIKNEWNSEELAYLADGNIDNSLRSLKITQTIDGETYEGYRATLCFSSFPNATDFPYSIAWMHHSSNLSFPADLNLRFTVEPARKVLKQVSKKIKDIMDQIVNMQSSGGSATIEAQEQLQSGQQLEYLLKKFPEPWIFGRFRITVEASSIKELKERVKETIDSYRAHDIHVVWPAGDQLSLFKDGLPNDRVRLTSYYQRHTLPTIGTGLSIGSGSAGDSYSLSPNGKLRGWIGPYIGYTTGITKEPVFLSMHSTIDTNNANGLAIVGSPGSGKTFCALTLTYQAALSGAWTIFIDPKADAKSLINLPGLENSKVIDLRNGNAGILDPFSIGSTPARQKELAREVIYLFLGGMEKVSHEEQIQLDQAMLKVTEYDNPSLGRIASFLQNNPNQVAQSLGIKLQSLSDLPFAQLCFTKSGDNVEQLRFEDGLTILTLLGLDLPQNGVDSSSFSLANRLAQGIMYLLTTFTKELMLSADKKQAKAIVVDEAWAITSTDQGKNLVNAVARMGRAHNTTLTLISQNSGDFTGEKVTNSVSTRLVFRATDDDEVKNMLNFIQMEDNENNHNIIKNLRDGECLLKDWSGRIARVQIDAWQPDFERQITSNPRDQANKQ